ncbi:MAG: diguanylate cyclase [Dissulfurimicrobium sp.]|uniref:diguanylate cyclase n=1 Tax=Dissulfurimicrobium sp. TaxID=2022436 RepID=UPI004049E214
MDFVLDSGIQTILNKLDVGILLVDKTCNPLFVNQNTMSILGIDTAKDLQTTNYPLIHNFSKIHGPDGSKDCFLRLLSEQNSCESCPINLDQPQLRKTIDYMICNHRLKHILVILKKLNNIWILSLRDVTRERKLIEDYSFIKKELNAKLILEEYKTRQLKAYQEKLQILLENLPDRIAIINQDHYVIESNFFLREKLSQKVNGEARTKCFEIFNRKIPCQTCPLKNAMPDTSQLIGHEQENEHITENFIPLHDGTRALLVFKDDTNKVKLIKQIKAQQQQLNEQKDLFIELSNLMLIMQQPKQNVSDVAQKVLETMLSKIGGSKGILIVDDLRKGTIWLQISSGIELNHIQCLIRAYLSNPTRKDEIFVFTQEVLPPTAPDERWFQLPINSNEDGQIGILLLNQDSSSLSNSCCWLETGSVIDLYFKPFLSWIQNRLLLKKLEERANIDGLTGLYNRHYFEMTLAEEITKSKEYGIPFSIIVGDLNGLKFINDTYGHQAGDELIKAAAMILRKGLRETDIPARIGGDEFYILLPNTDLNSASKVLERIKKTFKEKELAITEGVSVQIDCSFGVAGSDRYPPDKVAEMADKEMYTNKKHYYAEHQRYR